MTRYRLSDGKIGTMASSPPDYGGTNPDKDGDLWLQVDGEKALRVVSPSEAYRLTPPVQGDWAPPPEPPLTLDQMRNALTAAGYTVLTPENVTQRARELMAGLEAQTSMTPLTADEWLAGRDDALAVKAYTYLREWARTL